MSIKLATRLGRSIQIVLLAGLAGVLGTGVSFIIMRHLTREMTMVPTVDPAAMQQARLLRAWSNELIELMEEHLEHLPMDARGCTPPVKEWVNRSFLPRLDDLRARIDEVQHWRDLEAYRVLGAAADRARSMGLHPEDTALRGAAAGDIAHAAGLVEGYIKDQHLSSYLVVPARAARFSPASRRTH